MSKQMNLLMESWRKFVNEAETAAVPDAATAQQLDNIVKMPYEQFVTQFAKIAADPKVQAVLKYGLKDGQPNDEKLQIVQMNAKVSVLKPTQNEIDLGKSLGFPLKDLNTFNTYKEGGIVAPNKAKIVTAEKGKYIIDGHHRWSQVYCINPDTVIEAIDITIPGADPTLYLKIVQMSIAADIQKIVVNKVDGTNLLTVDDKTLMSFVQKNSIPEVVQSAGGLDKLQSLIVTNKNKMKTGNQPVPGAPKRDFMPQTDDAKNWTTKASSGEINFKDTAKLAAAATVPSVQKESLKKIVRQVIRENLKRK
jgi:hypothetical protein